ncbi:MAG: precorrin-2 C(20)-methyltransferase [Thermodesulfobacteriota bacterium]|nr:MAG: precorrin-2 C(20)-methyltransferase [Thermodesulfobacteriota bacterium]
MNTGTLFGIGVGPGDPDLITLKAANILKQVDVVFAAASTKNGYSLAEEIASTHLKDGMPLVRLGFPMTRSTEKLQTAWEENACTVVDTLRKGKDAAFVTIGDPMTYSTFGYLMRTIKEIAPDTSIEIVPGITSYQAATAAAGEILAEAEESFTVISGAMGAKKLGEVIDHTDRVVMLKVYREYKEIMDALDQLDLLKGSVLVSRCGLEGERIVRNLEDGIDSAPPYLSLLLISKK